MAAAEARAAWQRAANRCLVQEDRKRAPKLACCPSASEQHHGTNNDIRWWLQLQPNLGIQKDLVSEVYEKKLKDSAHKPKYEEPLPCETFGTNAEKSPEWFEAPQMVSAYFTNYSSERRGLDDLRSIEAYSHVLDFESSDPPPLKNLWKAGSDMNAPWKETEKTQPWWQITDENELASLVAERTIQHIENCDLPRPTQTVHVHTTESQSHGSKSHPGEPSSPAGRVSHPGFQGQCEHINCSYGSESTDKPSSPTNRVQQQHDRNYTYSPAQDSSNISYAGSDTKRNPNAIERDEILEALRHSQTRAREAEMAAKKASSEKDDVIKVLLRQASHLFACNQWLKILQLENIGLQLKHKEDQIANVISEFPWMTPKEKPTPGQEQKDWYRKKGRKKEKGGSFFDVILFAVGLGLAGAGFLLGWTLGWLLPKL